MNARQDIFSDFLFRDIEVAIDALLHAKVAGVGLRTSPEGNWLRREFTNGNPHVLLG